MKDLIDALPAAASSIYALAAYSFSAIVFLLAGARLRRIRAIVASIAEIPESQRKRVIEIATNTILPTSITVDDWIKVSRLRWRFALFGSILIAATTIIVVLASGAPFDGKEIERRLGGIEAATERLADKPPEIFGDLLTPRLTSTEAYQSLMDAHGKDLNSYDLIDILGSFYICLKKPDTLFYQFPEWFFIFRSKARPHKFFEFRVADSRVPRPASIPRSTGQDDERQPKDGADVFYFVTPKVNYVHTNSIVIGPAAGANAFFAIVDERGLTVRQIIGRYARDSLIEVTDGPNSIVIARAQVANRTVERVNEYLSVESPARLGTTTITKASFSGNKYYAKAMPIGRWVLGAEEAVRFARAKGAQGMAPDKTQAPGLVRLRRGHRHPDRNSKGPEELQGAYWNIPYRIGLRHVLVDGVTGEVYAVDFNTGRYSKTWGEGETRVANGTEETTD